MLESHTLILHDMSAIETMNNMASIILNLIDGLISFILLLLCLGNMGLLLQILIYFINFDSILFYFTILTSL